MKIRDLKSFIVWCRDNGVLTIEVPGAKFTLNPNWDAMKQALAQETSSKPTEEEIQKLAQALQGDSVLPIVEESLEQRHKRHEAEIDVAAVGYPLDPFAGVS